MERWCALARELRMALLGEWRLSDVPWLWLLYQALLLLAVFCLASAPLGWLEQFLKFTDITDTVGCIL